MKTLQNYIDEVGLYGEKLFLRNEAIRSGLFDKYRVFLMANYPDSASEDIIEAQELAGRVLQVDKSLLKDWITNSKINVVTSDLYVLDEGSILTGTRENTDSRVSILGDGLEDIIQCSVSPDEVIMYSNHSVYWVDPVVKA